MAMDINNVYNNYTGSYMKTNEKKEAVKSSEKQGAVEKAEQKESARKTAADELSYLTKNFDGITFVAANFKPGMRYGTLATTNIAISPEFLKKMANDPALEKEYTDQFENMKKLDEQNIKLHEAQGRRLVAQGWAIDKNGGMSKWGISEADNKRHYGQEMTDYANKIRKQKLEKKKEQEKIAAKKEAESEKKAVLEEKKKADREERELLKEQIDSSAKELLGEKYKGAELFDISDVESADNSAKITDAENVTGLNLDIKL